MRRCGDRKRTQRTWTLGDFDQHVAMRFRGWMRLRVLPTRGNDPKDQHLLVLGGSTDSTCAANHDPGTAAPPNYILSLGHCEADIFFMFLCPSTKIEHKHVTGTAQSRSATHKTSIAIGRGESTSPTCFHLACSSHTVLASSAASEPQSHVAFRAVVSCSLPRF